MKKLFLLLFLLCGLMFSQAIASEGLTVIVIELPIDQAITELSEGGYVFSWRLVAINAVPDTVIDKTYSEGFNEGGTPNEFRKRIGARMQFDIDSYQRRHTLFTSAAFIATAAILEAGLDGGI